MDVNEMDELLSYFNEHKFNTNKILSLHCECGKVNKFEFDTIPDFFPDTWLS
jgi:hypothetical protein